MSARESNTTRLAAVALLAWGAAVTALPQAEESVAPEPAASVEPPPAFEGALSDGIERLRELAEGGKVVEARALADELLAPRGVARTRLAWWNDGNAFTRGVLDATAAWTEPLGWNGRPAAQRAIVRLERGLVSLAPDQRVTAEGDFGRALALAPDGPTRLAASYDLALLPLLEGEEWRAQIPELGGTPAAPPAPPVAGAPGAADGEEAPDPLEEAKRAYREARRRFIDRLKLDWRDEDTRANVELIQRRLRELDEVERQREEQEQQQQDQQQDQENQDEQDQQDGEPQDQQDDQQSEEQSDESQDGEDEQQPEDGEQGEDESKEESEPDQQEEAEPQEVHLSQEELQRLLNRLAEHEKEAEQLREMRRQQGSRGVDRDW